MRNERTGAEWRVPSGDTAAAFAKTKRTNPFAANQRLQLPLENIEVEGMKNLRAHCISFSGLPPQVY